MQANEEKKRSVILNTQMLLAGYYFLALVMYRKAFTKAQSVCNTALTVQKARSDL